VASTSTTRVQVQVPSTTSLLTMLLPRGTASITATNWLIM